MKPEETKPIKDTSNNQSRPAIIFNDLITEIKELMNKLYNIVDYNNLNYEYVGLTKDVSFYEYRDSEEIFNAIKNNQIKFIDARNSQNKFLNKLSNIKIGRKSLEQEKIIISKTFTFLDKKLLIFLKTLLKYYLM